VAVFSAVNVIGRIASGYEIEKRQTQTGMKNQPDDFFDLVVTLAIVLV
jgi:hypothetical protein